jgi:glycosyltransferase involved in cell wall biosynthesis
MFQTNTKQLCRGLTIIIPFRNEKERLKYTLTSIRETTVTNPEIILINDNSIPDFDYEGIAKKYHCRYVYHKLAVGAAASRDEGVYLCETEYFLLLDAHMDFYEQGWDKRILEILSYYPDSILFGQTASLKCQENKNFNSFGATLKIHETFGGLAAKWLTKDSNPDANIIEVPIVLGASYLSSVKHWNRIH